MDAKIAELEPLGYTIKYSTAPLAIVIVTPLMSRFLSKLKGKVPHFVDSACGCDQTDTSITSFLAPSEAGAIPIAIMLHDSQSTESYATGFNMIKSVWDKKSKYEIACFVCDDSSSLHAALKITWPLVIILLCIFHVLQALWNWLFKAGNKIELQDRKLLINNFKNLVYAENINDFQTEYEKLIALPQAQKYDKFIKHVDHLYDRKEMWAFAYRKNILVRGHNTNNFAEASFRIFKDIILKRLKAFNIISLMNFITQNLEEHYSSKLLLFVYDRERKPYLAYKTKLNLGEKYLNLLEESIVVLDENLYQLTSSSNTNKSYTVDSTAGVCTCYAGSQGSFCKHQVAVHLKYNIDFPNSPLLSLEDKKELLFISQGVVNVDEEFFKPMLKSPVKQVDNVESDIIIPDIISPEINECAVAVMEEDLISESLQSEPNTSDEARQVLAEYNQVQQQITDLIQKNMSDGYLIKRVKQYTETLKKQIKSGTQFSAFLTRERYKKGRMIHVQPTSISRRQHSLNKGRSVQRCGRPLKCIKKNKPQKRPRNLALNISQDRANAKSHGEGH